MVGIITEMEQAPGDDDRTVTVNGQPLRVLDPCLRRIAGPSLGADRLLIYWETDDGPYFAVSVKGPASDCYNLRSGAAYDTGDSIAFVWSDQAGLGVQLPKAPAFEPRLADIESRALFLPIELCLDERGSADWQARADAIAARRTPTGWLVSGTVWVGDLASATAAFGGSRVADRDGHAWLLRKSGSTWFGSELRQELTARETSVWVLDDPVHGLPAGECR